MKSVLALVAVLSLLASVRAQGHHSFAIYDIDNRIERTGVLTALTFSSPHILLALEVENADGGKETWRVESLSPGRWDRQGHPRDIAAVGETVTLEGWPARNGEDGMLLRAITTQRGKVMIIDKVRQRRARIDIPETTVRRH